MVSSKSLFEQSSLKQELGLGRISVVKYSSEVDPLILASKISKLEEVEWAAAKIYLSR